MTGSDRGNHHKTCFVSEKVLKNGCAKNTNNQFETKVNTPKPEMALDK